MRKSFIIISLWLAAPALGQPVPAVLKPASVPASWELTFRFQDPQRVSVFLPGKALPAVYWYMLYTVENATDQEIDFYPTFELVTDTLQVLSSEVGVSPEAYRAVARRAGDPLLVTPEKVIGRLLRGKDRARHSVAIWPDFDPQAKRFTIYVGGLSGEVKRLKNPAFDSTRPESETNRRYFTLRKTLEIPYRLPGSRSRRSLAVPQRADAVMRWIMR